MKPHSNGKLIDLPARKKEERDLGVIVACHNLVCAIPVRWVSRLAMVEEARKIAGNLMDFGGTKHAAFDLGERLGLMPLDAAWVLLQVPYRGSKLALALRTGTCLVVQPLPKRIELPSALYSIRQTAVAGVFVADATHGGALVGLELDIPHLWTESELEASDQLLRGSRPR